MFHLVSYLVQKNPIYTPIRRVLQELGRLWRVVSLDWIIGGDFGKKFRRISKEDKLNYKI